MPLTTSERTEIRDELSRAGYAWKYIDEWQPKVTLYRHKEMENSKGDVVSKVGTKLENLPGNPDYVNRKAKQGLLAWAPSDGCTCRWCAERKEKQQPESSTQEESKIALGRGTRK